MKLFGTIRSRFQILLHSDDTKIHLITNLGKVVTAEITKFEAMIVFVQKRPLFECGLNDVRKTY